MLRKHVWLPAVSLAKVPELLMPKSFPQWAFLCSLLLFFLLPHSVSAQAPSGSVGDPQKPSPAASPLPPRAPAAPEDFFRVAVFNLEAKTGVDSRTVDLISESLLAEIRKLRSVKAIGSKEIDALLGFEQKKQMSGCDDTSCAVEIGGALGVDKIVLGSLGRLGRSFVYSVKVIDVRNAKVDSAVSERLIDLSDEQLLDLVPPTVKRLFPERQKQMGESLASELPTQPPARGVRAMSVLGWTSLSLGVAAAVAGGIMVKLASDDNTLLQTGNFDSLESKMKAEDTVNTKRAWATYLLIGGGSLGAIGATLLIIDAFTSKSSAQAPVAAGVSFDSRSMVLSLKGIF